MSTATDLLLIRSGITYRQLDHWVRQGWVKPRFLRRNGEAAEGGSGYTRDFSEEESRVVLRMGRLVNVGLKAEEAALAARSMVDRDEDWVRLDGGVEISIAQAGIEGWLQPTEVHMETVDVEKGVDL